MKYLSKMIIVENYKNKYKSVKDGEIYHVSRAIDSNSSKYPYKQK